MIHTDIPRYIPEGAAQVELCTSHNSVSIWSIVHVWIYIYTQGSPVDSDSTTLEPDWLQHDYPIACVIS